MTIVHVVGVFFLLCAVFCGGLAVATDACRKNPAAADLQTRNGAIELGVIAVIGAVVFLVDWPLVFGAGARLFGWLARI